MGKMLKVLGAVFLLLIVGFVGLLIWSHEKGEATQERFYAAVDTQDPEKVLELFDVRLLEKVDAPVLAMWMKAFRPVGGSTTMTARIVSFGPSTQAMAVDPSGHVPVSPCARRAHASSRRWGSPTSCRVPTSFIANIRHR